MTTQTQRSGSRMFLSLLFKGQRVDWKYSLVVVLVITGMFSTPLALGSIRNRVYVAVKEQIEKENNAREIEIHLARDEARLLDDELVAELKGRFPGSRVVGNHELVVTAEGPEGTDFLTLRTLAPGDPRQDPLQIVPEVPADFGLTDVVVSDTVGQVLYGEAWETLWSGDGTVFNGPPLRLEINDLPVEAELRVVARRRLPGKGFYVSSQAGVELRRYTQGFGSAAFNLPIDEGLVQFALPDPVSAQCTLFLEHDDPTCGDDERRKLEKRLKALQFGVEPAPELPFPFTATSHSPLGVRLTELIDDGNRSELSEKLGDCRQTLAPHLVDRCVAARILPDIAVEAALAMDGNEPREVTVIGIEPDVEELLPGVPDLRDRLGTAPGDGRRAIGLLVPDAWELRLGAALELGVSDVAVPASVRGFYACETGGDCRVFASSLEAFRLRNLRDGVVEVRSREPLVFVPAATGEEYDEVLVYAPEVEDVEPLAAAISQAYPDYSVAYNVAAIDKLKRQDSRLSTLFTITISLSAVFIILALGALAQINVERRNRQMAQMLILGFSRRFVRWLVVAEYLFLTLLSSLCAYALTALLCFVARSFLRTAGTDAAARGFKVIVDSMNVDLGAFLSVFGVVAVCTWVIAVLSAARSAKSDPLNLLD